MFHIATQGQPKPSLRSLPLTLSIAAQTPIPAYSKGARGLSVLLRAGGIFTAITTSPSPSGRQRFFRYKIRAGRNLPDKEFRYLRTVIVTADIHGDLGSKLWPCGLTSPLNLSALVTCHSLYVVLTTLQRAVFLLNSRRTHFTETRSRHIAATRPGTPSSEVTGLVCRVPSRGFTRAPESIRPAYLCRFAVRSP